MANRPTPVPTFFKRLKLGWRNFLWGLGTFILVRAVHISLGRVGLHPEEWVANAISVGAAKAPPPAAIGWLVAGVLTITAAIFGPDLVERIRRRLRPFDPGVYLSSKDSELSTAIVLMVILSAWGRWYRQQSSDDSGVGNASTLGAACHLVLDAAMNEKLSLRGRPPGQIEYEPISPLVWRLAALAPQPDNAQFWEVRPVPRYGVDPAQIARLLNYESIIVDSKEFQGLWPRNPPRGWPAIKD